MKNKLQRITSKIDEGEDQISDLEDKEENTQSEHKEKEYIKMRVVQKHLS